MKHNLKSDLIALHNDWQHLLEKGEEAHNPTFLKKMAKDIKRLHNDAKKEKGKYKEQAELVDYLLTTPWGAPFVSKMTLLEAAEKLDSGTFEELAKYGHEMKSQIFEIYDQVFKEL